MKRSVQNVPACLWAMLVVAILVAGGAPLARGQSLGKMIQEAKNQLRAATSLMQNGQREEAARGVQGVAEILYKVREADPNNSKLELVLWNTEELRNTLQKRMGTTIVLRTDPSAGESAAAEEALPADSEALAQKAADLLRNAEGEMHNGRNAESKALLDRATPVVAKLKQVDPGHRRMMALEVALENQVATVNKRLAPAAKPAAMPKAQAADPADVLAQQAGDLLRQAESEMHNGRKAESKALLEKAARLVAELRQTTPGHRRLMPLETALAGQSATVGSRLAPAVQPQAPGGAAAAPAQAPTGKLPYYTRNIVRGMADDLSSARQYLEKIATGTGAFDDDTLHGRIQTRIDSIEAGLPGLLEQAATDGVGDDPRVAGIGPALAELKARLATSKAGASERQATAAAAQAGADGDVAALRATFDRLNIEVFTKHTGSALYYNDLEAPRANLALLRKFEEDELPALQKQWNDFAKKYGQTGQAVNDSTGNSQASYPFEGIRDGIANVAKTREAMAEDLVQRSKDTIEGLPSLHDLYRVKGHDEARGFLKLAAAYSPKNAGVKALDKTIEKQLKADLEAYSKKVEGNKWPGNSKGKEAKAAMKFFENDPGWGKRDKNPSLEDEEPRKPIGVAITGDWSVQEKNILGQPTMYGIPALVAVQLDREKGMGLARVYSVTLRTAESANPGMKPPFTSVAVGSSYYVKAKKVK